MRLLRAAITKKGLELRNYEISDSKLFMITFQEALYFTNWFGKGTEITNFPFISIIKGIINLSFSHDTDRLRGHSGLLVR